jgi:hypothetical protein
VKRLLLFTNDDDDDAAAADDGVSGGGSGGSSACSGSSSGSTSYISLGGLAGNDVYLKGEILGLRIEQKNTIGILDVGSTPFFHDNQVRRCMR